MKKSEQLRIEIKKMASDYFNAIQEEKSQFTAGVSHIPVSGKQLGSDDLENLIDASLDMWLTTGRFNDKFEKELAKYLGSRYALSVNSGSSANLLAFATLTSPKLGERQVKKGDEVITVAAGFPTTINPIIQHGCIPVFVDIERDTYEIDTTQIETSITPKTKAIMVAHTLGNVFNIEKVMEIAKKFNLWVIEDNCDALGSKFNGKFTGTFGHLATLSFYPAHHITTGEGGAVIINDPSLYKIAMSFRDWGRDCWCEPGKDNTCGIRFEQKTAALPHGYDHKYIYSHIGYNLKMTDWQAAIGLSQLKKVDLFIAKRKENFDLLAKALEPYQQFLQLPVATPQSSPSWFGYLITVKKEAPFTKNDFVHFLNSQNIGTRQLFAGNMLRQPAYLTTEFDLKIKKSKIIQSTSLTESDFIDLPNTENVMLNSFWIGVAPLLTDEMKTALIKSLTAFLDQFNS